MNHIIKFNTLSFLAAAFLACGAPSKEAGPEKTTATQTPEPKKEEAQHEPPKPVEIPPIKDSDLKGTFTQVEAAYQELALIVRDGDLKKAHHTAERLAKLAAQLPELAQTENLPTTDIEEIKKASAEIDALFPPMDKAGDAGNRELSLKVFAKYEAPMAALKAKVK